MRHFALALFCILFSFVSCNKGTTTSEIPGREVESVYFVKYCTQGVSGRFDAKYKDEKGNFIILTNIAGNEFERTIGPVSKGFECSFSITMDYSKPTVRIEIKKDNEPFVVKKESMSSVSYVID